MMKRLIVYDLDGTLVDTSDDIVHAVNYMLQELQVAPLSRKAIIGFVGKGLEQLIAGCVDGQAEAAVTRGLALFRDYYAAHLLDHSTLYPGAREALEYFRDRTQAVVTNKPNPFSREILLRLGIGHYFVSLIAGEDEHPRKPDPSGLRWLMAQHRVRPDQTLLIGDSAVDVETGRNAAVHTVIVRHGFADEREIASAAPEFVIDNFSDLLKLAASQQW